MKVYSFFFITEKCLKRKKILSYFSGTIMFPNVFTIPHLFFSSIYEYFITRAKPQMNCGSNQLYWGGIITSPSWFLTPNRPSSWNMIYSLSMLPFCSHTTKRKVWCFLVESKVSPQHLQSQTRKAHTSWHEHSLPYCCDC